MVEVKKKEKKEKKIKNKMERGSFYIESLTQGYADGLISYRSTPSYKTFNLCYIVCNIKNMISRVSLHGNSINFHSYNHYHYSTQPDLAKLYVL